MEWILISGNYVKYGECEYTVAMNVPGGVLIRVVIQKLNEGRSFSVSQSMTFVPNAFVSEDTHKLMSMI